MHVGNVQSGPESSHEDELSPFVAFGVKNFLFSVLSKAVFVSDSHEAIAMGMASFIFH